MAGYAPHTEADVASMLEFLGLSSLDDLFSAVPAALRLAGGLDLPDGMTEPDVLASMGDLARSNRPSGRDLVCFAGGGAYDHEVPPVTRALASRSEFVTSYTPYQPEVAPGSPPGRLRVPDAGRPADRAWRWRTHRSTTGRPPPSRR
jgi:glycine dehydrogenase subunit 1